MKKIFIYCEPLACRRRALDAYRTYVYMLKNGYKVVSSPRDADFIVFFTCAAVNETTDLALEKIKKFQRCGAELIVAGCLPVIEKEKLLEIFAGRTVGTRELKKMEDIFPGKVKYSDVKDANFLLYGKILLDGDPRKPTLRTLYANIVSSVMKHTLGRDSLIYILYRKDLFHIRVAWGCPNRCSYCAIRISTGDIRSKPVERCVEELKDGLEKNFKDFIITAENVGAYGLDINSNLVELLREFLKIKEDYRLIIRNIPPWWIIKNLNSFLEILEDGRITAIEVPIESGSQRILQLMRRYPYIDKMKECFLTIKDSFPNISIYTHVIIGFPTESQKDFEETLTFLRDCRFDGGQIFPFSIKDCTEAKNIEPKVSKDVIFARMKLAKRFLKREKYRVVRVSGINALIFDKKQRGNW